MTSKADQAVSIFQHGRNCAQSVLSVFCEPYGLPREAALRLAEGMGGGFRQGEICGAAAGGVLVIGLKYGAAEAPAHTFGPLPPDAGSAPLSAEMETARHAQALCAAKTREFLAAFREAQGSFVCRDVLGCDMATPEGRALARPQFGTTCVRMVVTAVELLENMGC